MIRHLLLLVTLVCGLHPANLRAAVPPHLVILIGEDEYRTGETLPAFAETELRPLGYRVSIIAADPAAPNNFPGLVEALRDADLLFLSVRRRTPPREQLEAVRAHLQAGKALVGVRTASHAFALRSGAPPEDPRLASWQAFDPEVLGGHYHDHHGDGPKTTVTLAPGAGEHPILRGVSVAGFVGNGSLYKTSPLEPGTTPLLLGTIPGQPSEPAAWTHRYGPRQARVFYTSLGHPDDFTNPAFRRLLVNGVVWALQSTPPSPPPATPDR